MNNPVTDLERLAGDLRNMGDAARKITIVGAHQDENLTLTALTLARQLARGH